ncbi:hypothetical protein [Candidatus Poriferisodalis sp.]|uniref:hypothetical protein n=1 Tax=Candidatus Poriferisodalis sp. TaxID=3101277 RepID=UPI003B017CD1
MDALLRVTAPREWAVMLLVAIAVAAVVGWAVFGTVERSVTADCALVHNGQRYTVLSASAGNVLEVLSDVGSTVEPEQPIARIKDAEIDRQVMTAKSRVEILEASAESSSDALAAARADLERLEAEREWSGYIVSPFGGVLTGHTLVPGQAVAVGSGVAAVRGPGDGAVDALSLVAPGDADRLEAGMTARVVLDDDFSGDRARAFDAVVTEVAAHTGPSPAWLATFGVGANAEHGHLVRFRLTGVPELPITDGESCRARVVTDRLRPVRLLSFGVQAGAHGQARR